MTQAYSDPTRETDPWALPDIEVFHMGAAEFAAADDGTWMHEFMTDGGFDDPADYPERPGELAGWYYWYCFPGCMPEGDPMGPYASAEEAETTAQEDAAA